MVFSPDGEPLAPDQSEVTSPNIVDLAVIKKGYNNNIPQKVKNSRFMN